MKKIFSVLSIIIFGLSFAMAQTNETTSPKADKDAPEITFEQTEYDFGLIPYKGDATCEFVFKNTGKKALVLTNVKSSCGCTIPTWPRNPIEKKKKKSIKVKYDTKRQGKFHKTITVYSNATNSPITLTIRGEVEKPSAEEMKQIKVEREKRLEQQKKRQAARKARHAKTPVEKSKRLPEVK